jgi:hypothetical protein
MFSNALSKNHAVYETMWKNVVHRGRVHVHAHCVLDNQGYTQELRVRNTYSYSSCTNAPQCYIIRP